MTPSEIGCFPLFKYRGFFYLYVRFNVPIARICPVTVYDVSVRYEYDNERVQRYLWLRHSSLPKGAKLWNGKVIRL